MPARSAIGGNDAILSREFTLRRGRKSVSLALRVLRPHRERTGEYRCVYELSVGRKMLRRTPGIFGVDSVQALLLALGVVPIEVEKIARDLGGTADARQLSDLRALAASVATLATAPAPGSRGGRRSKRRRGLP